MKHPFIRLLDVRPRGDANALSAWWVAFQEEVVFQCVGVACFSAGGAALPEWLSHCNSWQDVALAIRESVIGNRTCIGGPDVQRMLRLTIATCNEILQTSEAKAPGGGA